MLSSTMRRLVVYAHYDAGNRVRRYVHHFLQSIVQSGHELVFVSNSALPAGDLQQVAAYASRAFARENVGFDFSMWAEAIVSLDASRYDELVLCNSSVVGPVGSLEGVFQTMNAMPCDFWGMTESFEYAWHLQSYFLVFRAAVLHSPAFQRFWTSVLPYKDKSQVIRSYEIGLSQYLKDQGFAGRAFASRDSLGRVPLWRRPLVSSANPTSLFPITLLKRGMPFVKIEALTHNPGKVWKPSLRAYCAQLGFDIELLNDASRPALLRQDSLR